MIKNEKGSVVSFTIVIIIIAIALASSATLLAMTKQNSLKTQYTHDGIQEEMLLRGEVDRLKFFKESHQYADLPDRKVEVKGPNRTTTYSFSNKGNMEIIDSYMGYVSESAYVIKSLVTAKRGNRYLPYTSSRYVPVKRYMERVLKNRPLSLYQYFTEKELSENAEGTTSGEEVKFWGPDVFYGPVHSNDNIFVQQAGGGSNDGWPTFYGPVTTHKELLYYSNGPQGSLKDVAPMDEIFLGGWTENVPLEQFSASADILRANAARPVPPDVDLVKININGGNGEALFGYLSSPEIEEFEVRSFVPNTANFANAIVAAGGNWLKDPDSLWTNYIPIYDTTWVEGPNIHVSNSSVFIECEMWIEGSVSGMQTYGCSDTIFIIDDIIYDNTTPGDTPDGYEGIDADGNPIYGNSINERDLFGLVSEQNILIRYKYRDPIDGYVHDENVDGVVIYGAYAALADGTEYGDMASHHDGQFTFEYHHRHGSTPGFWCDDPNDGENEILLNYIDFHKFIFPPNFDLVPDNILGFNLHSNGPGGMYPNGTCGFPFEAAGPGQYNNPGTYPNAAPEGQEDTYQYAIPDGTDWPWYNPVWPESAADISPTWYTAPGGPAPISLYGSIAQRRRGFIHRSGTDPFNHPNQFEYDLSDYHFGGTHGETGYAKDYYYDNRLLYMQPPDYPQVSKDWGGSTTAAYNSHSMFFKSPPRNGL